MNTNLTIVTCKKLLSVYQRMSFIGRFIFKNKPGARILPVAALVAWVAALAPQSATAATITFLPAVGIIGDTDVATNGTLLYAYGAGANGGTINGEVFAAGNSGSSWGGNVTLTSFGSLLGNGFGAAAAPFNTLSVGYSNILSGGAYGAGGATGTVTLNNLTPGHAYSVQFWENDSRGNVTYRYVNTGGNANTVTVHYNDSGSTVGAVGQYAIGYFVADATTQSFTLSCPSTTGLQINAISVRDNGSSPKVWAGGSSTSWGTAANWNPASVPLFPSDSVLFNSSSTANLATMLDVSYTLATLTLSNAPAPVSIGPDLNTLTINNGIDLLGASQSLTNLDALVLGASQTWNVANSGSLLEVNGGISGGSSALTITGAGSVILASGATYTGNTIVSNGNLTLTSAGSTFSANTIVTAGGRLINGGSIASASITVATNSALAMSGAGSFSGAYTLFMAGGATFDVSAETSTFNFGLNTITNTSSGVVLNGTNDFSSATFGVLYDGVDAPFIQTNGTLTLSSSTVININNTGPVLLAGNHTIIAAATAGNVGSVITNSTGTGFPAVTLTGNGAVGPVSLATNGTGGLDLVVGTGDVWTGAGGTNLWSTAGNWSGGLGGGPTVNPTEPVVFNNQSLLNLSNSVDSAAVVNSLTVVDPPGAVTIAGPSALAIGGGGINLQSATVDLTVDAPLTYSGNGDMNIATNRSLNINGGMSGGGGPIIVGAGTVNLNSASTLTGTTVVSGGSTLKLGAANVLSTGGNMTVNGLMDLQGNSQAMGALNGSGTVNNTGVGATTLIIGSNNAASTFNGIIQNTGGALALQVAGGNLTLNSSNSTYSGGTTFNGGNFSFPASYTLGTGPVTFNSGSQIYSGNCTFTNALILNGGYLHIGGNNDNQTWSGPVTVTNGFQMSGDNGNCVITLSGPMNIGTGGISVTNFGNEGPQEGYGVSQTGNLLSGPISGSGGITYWLSGANSRLSVQGVNTYSGGTIVNGDPANPGGKLDVYTGINNATNYCFSTGSVTLNTNAIIESAPGSATVTNALTLNGGILQSEPQYNGYNTLTWSGPVTLTADSALVQYASGALNNNQSSGVNVSGALSMNGFTLTCTSTVACYNGNILSGPISGAGNILESGNNNLTVSGSNTFTGTFRSVLGNLSVQNAYAMQNATLDMNAADSGSVSFSQDSTIGALTGTRNLANGGHTLTIGTNGGGTTYSGTLSGSGGLTKVGTGTLTLSVNDYTGNTTVTAGTLSIAQPTLALLSTVSVSNGAVLNLTFGTTNAVVKLVLGGVTKPNGVYNSANSSPYITGTGSIQVGAYPYIWSGALSGEWSTNVLGSPKNWLYNSAQTDYADGSVVLFDDTLTANNTVNISVANVSPALVSFNNNNTNYTIGGNFGIAGASVLIKNGSGTVTLTTTNTYTGSTTISNGTLTIGNAGRLGNGTYAGAITNNGTLILNHTNAQILSGIISGTGTVNYLGSGQLNLNGVNTFGGGITMTNGTVIPGNGSAFGTGAVTVNVGATAYPVSTLTLTNPLVLNGGKLEIGGGSDTVTWSGPITTTPLGCWLVGDNAGNVFNLSGSMNIGTLGTSITNSGSSTQHSISGPISGSGGINFVLNGSRLALSASNSYSGGTVVNGTAKLNVQNNYAFGTGPVTNNGAIIEEYQANPIITNALTLNGGTLETDYLYNDYTSLTWTGPVNVTANSTLYCAGNAGSGYSTSGVRLNGPVTMNGFTLTSTGNSQYNGNQINGSISGTGLIQVSALSLTLGGTNSFSGTNRAVGGTLSVNNVYALQNATLDMNAADSGSVSLNNLNCIIGALQGSRNLSLGVGTVSIGNNNASTSYTGILSGNASLVKVGTGTLTLSSNAYTWNTTVNAGTLSIAQTNLAFGSTVTVTNGAFLNLNFVGTNAVTALVLNGVSQPKGVYGSLNSGGFLTGTGFIQVGTTPNIWTGKASATWTTNNVGSPYNWVSNSIAGNYSDGSAVLFDDTLTANNVVLLTNTVSPIGVTFNNNNTNYTIGGSGSIGGACAIIKNGAGSVTLTNNNTYTGNTIINSNKLTIGIGGKLGNGAYAGDIYLANGATLEYTNSAANQTFSGPITGQGSLLLDASSSPTLTLSSTVNTYSGLTTISNGIRLSVNLNNISPNTTFNIAGSSSVGGQLYLGAAGTILNNFSLSGVGFADTTPIGAIRCAANTFTGTITLTGNARIGQYGTGVNTFNGQIMGSYNPEFAELAGGNSLTATWVLGNTGTANNYTGNTSISVINFANGSQSGTVTGCSSILKLGANEQIPNGVGYGIVVFNGGDANHLTVLELNGFNETINGVTNVSAAGAVIQNTTTGTSTLTIGDGNTNSTFTGVIKDGGAGSGKYLALTKIGAGSLTLSGANTYNGSTIINGGTLLVNGGTGTNWVSVNNGGTLGGTGIIAGSVTNTSGGTLTPGTNGVGKLTLSGNLTLSSGSTNTFAVNGSTPTNTSVALGAAVSYGGVLNIVPSGTFTAGQQFLLFTGAGATNTGNFASIAGSPGAGKAFAFTNGVLSVVSTGPTLTSVTPNPVTGSSYAVTLGLTGSGFTGATAVLLTNVTAVAGASYMPTVNSDTSISVSFVPGTTASTWNATVVNGSPSAQVNFTVTVPAKAIVNTANLNSAGAGKLVLSGTGGVAGNSYAVVSATNLNPPVVWTPVVTNVFGVGGSFNYTNTVNSSTPGLFLRIEQ